MVDQITLFRGIVEQALEAQVALLSLMENPDHHDAKKIRSLARASIISLRFALDEPGSNHTAEIERAVAAEREACAKIVDAALAKPVNEVRFYFMHDNHTFTRLKGATLDEVLAHADAVELSPIGSYGMLCPATLLAGREEVRRIGPYVYARGYRRGSKDPKDEWESGKAEWRKAMEADPDVSKLLNQPNLGGICHD